MHQQLPWSLAEYHDAVEFEDNPSHSLVHRHGLKTEANPIVLSPDWTMWGSPYNQLSDSRKLPACLPGECNCFAQDESAQSIYGPPNWCVCCHWLPTVSLGSWAQSILQLRLLPTCACHSSLQVSTHFCPPPPSPNTLAATLHLTHPVLRLSYPCSQCGLSLTVLFPSTYHLHIQRSRSQCGPVLYPRGHLAMSQDIFNRHNLECTNQHAVDRSQWCC